MWKKKRYWKWSALAIIALLLYVFQVTVSPVIFDVPINWMLPFVIITAICEGPVVGAAYGIYCGLLSDIFASPFGYTALIYMILAIAAGLIVNMLRSGIFITVAITAVAGLIYFTLTWFFFYYFWYGEALLYFRIVPLQILYSSLASVILYYATGFVRKHLDKAD